MEFAELDDFEEVLWRCSVRVVVIGHMGIVYRFIEGFAIHG